MQLGAAHGFGLAKRQHSSGKGFAHGLEPSVQLFALTQF
jgi:hypothetical protein